MKGIMFLNISYWFANAAGPIEPHFSIQVSNRIFDTPLHKHLLSIATPEITEPRQWGDRIIQYHYFKITPQQMSEFVLKFNTFHP